MGWSVTAEVEQYDQAVEAFRKRIPITRADADRINDFTHARGFTLAGVAQLDVVQDVHTSLLEAIKKGTTLAEWKKEIEAALTAAWGRKNSPRLETIFRNATMGAYNAGRRAQMLDPSIVKFRPFWKFDGIADQRQSEICQECNETILRYDDPWWTTHTPPLHHRCRSSIRNLRPSEAERQGVTPVPPNKDAQAGFGVPADVTPAWKPDPTKYAPQLFEAFKKKAAELEALPSKRLDQTPVLRNRADEFRSALELTDGGAKARAMLREQVKEVFPAVLPRNPGPFSQRLTIGKRDPVLFIADAYYRLNSGEVVAREGTIKAARAGAALVKRGAIGTESTFEKFDGIRILLHEELHGHSATSPQSYRGLAATLEEVGTEVCARTITARLSPLSNFDGHPTKFGAYHREVDSIAGTIAQLAGVDRAGAMKLIANAHAKGVLSRFANFTSESEAIEAFFGSLDVTDEQRKKIRDKVAKDF